MSYSSHLELHETNKKAFYNSLALSLAFMVLLYFTPSGTWHGALKFAFTVLFVFSFGFAVFFGYSFLCFCAGEMIPPVLIPKWAKWACYSLAAVSVILLKAVIILQPFDYERTKSAVISCILSAFLFLTLGLVFEGIRRYSEPVPVKTDSSDS